jgi:hypothetical protein
VSILGKAVLGIAGAYLLRALAESSIPKLPVLLVAIFYAYSWLIFAARVHRSSRFASATYAVTSALILSPLLWESTVRFQVLSPAFASVWLVIFVVLAIVLAWPRELQIVPWIATLSSLGTALSLIVATRDLGPFTAAILGVALATEVATCIGQKLTVRVIPALVANFVVWLLIYVMTTWGAVPEGYRAVHPQTITTLSVLLLIVYGSSIGIRGFLMRERIFVLDMIQGSLAFAVGSFGVLRSGHSGTGLGLLFLVLGAGCYWASLVSFGEEIFRRNRRVSAAWAAGLSLAGTFLLFSQSLQVIFLCITATGAAFLYTRTGRLSLGWHASLYLLVAAGVSPLLKDAANALAGSVPLIPDWQFWTVGFASALCYGMGSRHQEQNARRRLLWIIPLLLVGFAVAAVVVVAVVKLAAGLIEPQSSALSVVRTIVNCALALVFGLAGSRLKRMELNWAAYGAVGFGTIKLLFEDLRFGNAASLVISLLFYGTILIVLPRLAREEKLRN